jgi:hypothetical protein
MAADMSGINTDPNYAHSLDFNFTPSPSPIPQQKADYNTYNQQFTDFLGNQSTVPQLQDKYKNMFNIPYLQDTAQKQNNLAQMDQNQLYALPASVNSSTQNSLLTQGQKDRMIQAQSAPIATRLNQEQTAAGQTNAALGTAQTNMGQAVSAEQAQQMKMTQPWLQKYDAMTIANAAENAQWSQSNQMELDTLLANQRSGIALSEGQQQRMEQLAYQENAFQNNLALLEKQASYPTQYWGSGA